jgi:hypothetical protein
MLLRRIASAFRNQDWTTATVEFVIVVAGIFVGLQVDSWNSDRTDRNNERVILNQLHSDFTANAASLGNFADRHEQMVEELTFSLDTLTQGELPEAAVRRFRNAFISMYQLPSVNATMGGYDTVIASGDLAILTDHELKSRLAQLSANIDEESGMTDYFRDIYLLNREHTRDAVLLVPNDDRTDTNLRVNFDAIKNDFGLLLIVADQRRSNQIFGAARRGLANEFSEVAAYIETLLE